MVGAGTTRGATVLTHKSNLRSVAEMTRETVFTWFTESLMDYAARYSSERTVVSRFFHLLEEWPRSLYRERREGHLTASGWVVSRNRVLLIHHRKLDRWLQPGGHADGDGDLPAVARREIAEETGIRLNTGSSDKQSSIFDLDIHLIPEYGDVPEHEHFDVRFLFEVTADQSPVRNSESYDVGWILLDELERYSEEVSILRMRGKYLSGDRY